MPSTQHIPLHIIKHPNPLRIFQILKHNHLNFQTRINFPHKLNKSMKRTNINMMLFSHNIIYHQFSMQLILPIKMSYTVSYLLIIQITLQKEIVKLLINLLFMGLYFLGSKESVICIAVNTENSIKEIIDILFCILNWLYPDLETKFFTLSL